MRNQTEPMILTPENGSEWMSDASINTEGGLHSLLGESVDLDLPECVPFWDEGFHGWDHEQDVLDAINAIEDDEYVHACRENVYNHEQDFSSIFTFSIYTRDGEMDEWYYRDDVYVVVCLHRGGDARGNYGGCVAFKADNLAESGFLDWMIGWHVVDQDGECVDEAGEFRSGWDPNPTCHLEDHIDGGEWIDGAFHTTLKATGQAVVCHPECNADY